MSIIIVMKYRGREEILASILESIEAGSGMTKTKIMYESLLSYEQGLYYLEYLLNNELLTYDQSNGVYNMTRKGLKFLALYNKTTNLLKISDITLVPSVKRR